jgi:hypothetical protein
MLSSASATAALATQDLAMLDGHGIAADEIVFHPHSFGDPAGRLFSWRGGLYRAIALEERVFFEHLFEAGVVQHLVGRQLLVDSELTPLVLEGYGAVVKHRRIQHPSYPVEWCTAMLRDAALTMVDLLLALDEVGLTLKDGHPWNVVFDGPRPIYVDLGSIAPAHGVEWERYDDFCRFCYYPLLLLAYGREPIGRCLLAEDEGVHASDLVLLPRAVRRRVRPPRATLAERISRRCWPRTRVRRQWIERLRRDLEMISPPPRRDGSSQVTVAPTPGSRVTAETAISAVVGRLRPASVMVLGRLVDTLAPLVARQTAVVAASEDPSTVAGLYTVARTAGLRLSPVVMDFTKPTPSRGVANHWLVSATHRLRCDMVVALDAVDRAAELRHLTLDQIVEALSALTTRWLVVESVRGRALLTALRKRFRSVGPLPTGSRETDVFLCEQPALRRNDG